MKKAVVFQGINALDFEEVRSSLIRIPEVSKSIDEAQKIMDEINPENGMSLFNFIASEDKVFLGNIRLKSLASAVCQLGLFARYLKTSSFPDIVVGSVNGDSAANVVTGKVTFREMVESNVDSQLSKIELARSIGDAPILSGVSLTEFGVYVLNKNEYSDGKNTWTKLEVDRINPLKIISYLVANHQVSQLVNLGPGNVLYSEVENDLRTAEVQVLDSIDLDPMLSWFWSGIRRMSFAMAQ